MALTYLDFYFLGFLGLYVLFACWEYYKDKKIEQTTAQTYLRKEKHQLSFGRKDKP